MKVGILGGGQLGRFLGQSMVNLGLTPSFYEPSSSPPTKDFCHVVQGSYEDLDRVATFAKCQDLILCETENIPKQTLDVAESYSKLSPKSDVMGIFQDRLREKDFLSELGLEVAPYVRVDDQSSFMKASEKLAGGCILKTRLSGYDGKGQTLIDDTQAPSSRPEVYENTVLEQKVLFDREVSQISVRNHLGEFRHYPLCENFHHNGILAWTKVLIGQDGVISNQAVAIAEKILNKTEYIGVATVEFFQVGTRLVVNEIAPRVHNSGHWTMGGAETSQFENHIRATTGLPLGSPDPIGFPFMYNLIGEIPSKTALLEKKGLQLYDYGKQSRPNRKVGHLSGIASSESQRAEILQALSCIRS